jgi:DNA-binding NarL/FixJ family response regulator
MPLSTCGRPIVVITVLIADDDQLIRAGLRLIIESDQDLTVVGEAANGHEASELATTLRPDVVLMDVRMPETDAGNGRSAGNEEHRQRCSRIPPGS